MVLPSKSSWRFLGAVALALLASFVAMMAAAQPAYPTKPVRLVVPYAPGGPNDVMARVLAQQLTAITGQAVVVENKAGAGGIIGTDAVAKVAESPMVLMLPGNSRYRVAKELFGYAKALATPEVLQRFQEVGAAPAGGSAASFQAFIAEEVQRWQQTVKTAGIEVQ